MNTLTCISDTDVEYENYMIIGIQSRTTITQCTMVIFSSIGDQSLHSVSFQVRD